jgi:hypothetical protein
MISYKVQKEPISSLDWEETIGFMVTEAETTRERESCIRAKIDPHIVTLATQSYGAADGVSKLKQGTSAIMIHGSNDKVLPVYCSEEVYQQAHEPKQIVICEGAGHGLDEVSEAVYELIYGWLVNSLLSQDTF